MPNDRTDSAAEMDRAAEVFLDVMALPMLDGKDDDDLVLVDGFVRSLAEQLGLATDFPEIEPMPAGVLRERWRTAKGRLASGDGPTTSNGRSESTCPEPGGDSSG